MVANCIVCGSRGASPNVSLHKLPKNSHPTIKEKWISYLKCYGVYEITENTRICSKHFKPYYINKFVRRPRLTMSAWPSVHIRRSPVEPIPKQGDIEIINVGYEDLKLLHEGIIVEYVTYNKSYEFCGNSMKQHEIRTNHNNRLFYPSAGSEEEIVTIEIEDEIVDVKIEEDEIVDVENVENEEPDSTNNYMDVYELSSRTNETEKDLIESRSSVFEVHTNKQCKVIKNQNDDLLQSRDIDEELVLNIKEDSYGSLDIDIIKEEIGSPFSKDIIEEIDYKDPYGCTDIDIIKEEIDSPFSNIINNFECKTKIKVEDNALDIKVENDLT